MCILGGKWQKQVRQVVLSTASVGVSCESSSDATSSSVVDVLQQLQVPRLVFCVCNVTWIVSPGG